MAGTSSSRSASTHRTTRKSRRRLRQICGSRPRGYSSRKLTAQSTNLGRTLPGTPQETMSVANLIMKKSGRKHNRQILRRATRVQNPNASSPRRNSQRCPWASPPLPRRSRAAMTRMRGRIMAIRMVSRRRRMRRAPMSSETIKMTNWISLRTWPSPTRMKCIFTTRQRRLR